MTAILNWSHDSFSSLYRSRSSTSSFLWRTMVLRNPLYLHEPKKRHFYTKSELFQGSKTKLPLKPRLRNKKKFMESFGGGGDRPAVAFHNSRHVSIIAGDEYITGNRDQVIKRSHLGGVILEGTQLRRAQNHLFSHLRWKKYKKGSNFGSLGSLWEH